MNIFFVDRDPKLAARALCDIHVQRMLFESCQLLNTAHKHLDGKPLVPHPAPTHHNHPCAKWVRSGFFHYMWLARHTAELAFEYERRFNKTHAYTDAAHSLAVLYPDNLPLTNKFDKPPQCMPDEHKCEDTVQAYRNYYTKGKSHLYGVTFGYTNTTPPAWLTIEVPNV